MTATLPTIYSRPEFTFSCAAARRRTPWHSLPEAIKTITELGASPKRVCLCTDDRDADDLFMFGMDWVAREAVKAGMSKVQAWSMGSLHGATRYGMDNDFGGLGHSRRADIVLLNDALEVQSTWYGGELVVEDKKITQTLETQLESKRYRYPKAAYQTVKVAATLKLTPDLPAETCTANVIRTELPGIVLVHERVKLEAADSWQTHFTVHDLCFVAIVERHGKSGAVAHGLLQNFGLKTGAVASSVGHDAHNLIVAGVDEESMRLAVETLKACSGGVVVVENGEVAVARRTACGRVVVGQARPRSRCRNRNAQSGLDAARLHAAVHGFQPHPAVGHPRNPHHR